MSYGKRLEQAMAYAKKSRSSLANELGCTPQTIGIVITWAGDKERKLSTEYHEKAAKFLNVNTLWLATGQGEMTPSSQPQEISLENNPDYPAIRRVCFKLSAGASGFGVDYSDDDAAPIVFQRVWYDRRGLKPEKLFAIKVRNSSMEPGLCDGDTVVVNTVSTTPRDGIVFAVNYEGELVIKRLLRDAGAWWLCSDNPDQHKYPRKRMTDECFIIGEIVHKQSERI